MLRRWVLGILAPGLFLALGCARDAAVSPPEATADPAAGLVQRTAEPKTWSELKEMYRVDNDNRPPKDDD